MKMKKAIVVLILVFTILAPSARAQETIMDEINYNQLEKFIQMAKDYYPQRKILAEQESQAKNSLTMSSLSYLDLFSASYFYRPQNKQAINPENPYITNGVQFGVNLNLGGYLQKPFQAKNARSNLEIVKLEKQVYDNELEKEVKNRYYNYILQLKELKLKTVAAQDVSGTVQDLTNRFEKGEITLDEYNSGRASLSDAGSTKMQTEINYLRAKDDLEEIIGVKLTDVN